MFRKAVVQSFPQMYDTCSLYEIFVFWSFFSGLDFSIIILERILNSAPPSWLVRSLALA